MNFVSGGEFAFVVNREVGAGPRNLVLAGMEFDSLRTLEIGSDGCFLNGAMVPFDHSTLYNSSLQVETFNRDMVQSNIDLFQSALV